MWKIRTTRTGSGSTAVQVVERKKGKTIIIKHLGSVRTTEEIRNLRKRAESYILQKDSTLRLFSESLDLEEGNGQLVTMGNLDLTNHYHHFAYDFLLKAYRYGGFNSLGSNLLRDLVIIRILEPASKIKSLELLKRYFTTSYSPSYLYGQLPKIKQYQEKAEEAAVAYARKHLNFDFSLVFYDVTTLYFETFKSDEDGKSPEGEIISGLRKPGFSKDGKSNQPQVLVALVVNSDGYPVACQTFSGNKFEGHTFIPIILSLKERYGIKDLTIVADAAMLSRDNMEELESQGLSYIVGARLSNLKPKLMEQVSREIKDKPGTYFKTKVESGLGYLICDFSDLRALKDKSDRKKQLLKAQNQIDDPGKYLKRSRFVRETTTSVYELNQELVDKDTLMDGIKGYYTNLEGVESKVVVARYHDLWKIEKAFRIAKSDLLARPIFHHKRESIEAHLLIVFVSLCVTKSLELISGLSIKRIKELIWDILDVTLTDKVTEISYTKQMTTIPEEIQDTLDKLKS